MRVLNDGSVSCWGSNVDGELGIGNNNTDSPLPFRARGIMHATRVAVGSGFTCALLADQTVQCWGRNDAGQLGDGSTTSRNVPVPIPSLDRVAGLALGEDHACAWLLDGTARCWGNNVLGELGNGVTTPGSTVDIIPVPTPVAVVGLSGVTQIAVGRRHSCALRNDGTAACWGYSGFGQLGDGSYGSVAATPVDVSW
jgi:alpha-tubulin suppressor-like RCC1 family protein